MASIPLVLHPDRLFPADPATRELARALYATVKDLPIVSPHGHTDPQWFADDAPFANASALFITPDHYVFRMLYSQGVALEDLGIPRARRRARRARRAQDLADLRRALPPLPRHADAAVARSCVRDGVRHRRAPDAGIGRSLLRPHQRVPRAAGVPAARAVRALQHRGDRDDRVAARSARAAPRRSARRAGRAASSPPIGPTRSSIPSSTASATTCKRWARSPARTRRPGAAIWPRIAAAARTSRRWARRRPITAIRRRARAICPKPSCQRLLDRALAGSATADEAEPFRGQMLTEMARMSLDDGLVMQIHPGSFRNHNPAIFRDLRPRQGRRHPDPHRLRARAEAAARPLRQRARPHAHPVHARRDDVRARAGAAGRATIRS